jgi:hypothetical protein
MELDQTFWTGLAAVASAVIVFCGSVWLVLSIVLGNKLAYFVTATITLAFVFIMSLVWSFAQPATPLGPVGDLPEFLTEAVGEPGEVDFGAASSYPESPWRQVSEEDQAETARAAEAETAALDAIELAIQDEEVTTFETVEDAAVVADSTRFLEQDGTEYAATLVGPVDEEVDVSDPEGAVLVVSRYEPGSPLGVARTIMLGTFALLALHLFFLSRSERKARALAEQTA